MNTLRYLSDPELAAQILWPAVATALAVAVLCAGLSVLVVLKRLAFIGQGVSHSAFGGVGLAFLLGITGLAEAGASAGEAMLARATLLGVVIVFALGAALLIAWLSDRRGTPADTAIGIVLAFCMAIGFVLLRIAAERAAALGRPMPPTLESVLFGSVAAVGWSDAAVAWLAAVVVIGVLWWTRRSMLFWAFDAPAARAFGVSTEPVRATLLVLLAVATVVTMKLAGVVLATAMLVLPGAIALRLSARLRVVMILSVVAAVVGVLLGLVASFELDVGAGPGIVGALVGLFALSRLAPAGAAAQPRA